MGEMVSYVALQVLQRDFESDALFSNPKLDPDLIKQTSTQVSIKKPSVELTFIPHHPRIEVIHALSIRQRILRPLVKL